MSPVDAYWAAIQPASTSLALLLRTSTAHKPHVTGLVHRSNNTAWVPAIGLGSTPATLSLCHTEVTWPPPDGTCASEGITPLPRTKTIVPSSSQATPSDPLTCAST